MVNSRGAALKDELHDPSSPLTIVTPGPTCVSCLRFIQTPFQAITQYRYDRLAIRQMMIERF